MITALWSKLAATTDTADMHRFSAAAGSPQRHLLHVFPSFGVGGIPLRMVRVINHLGARYRHTVVALDGVTAAADQLNPGCAVTLARPHMDKRRPLRTLLQIARSLGEIRPDALLTYNWGAIEWAAVNRVFPRGRHLHFEAGFGVEEANRQLPRRVIGRRLALGACERLVVPSRTLERIAREQWRISPKRLVYLPDGIDLRRFRPAHQGECERDAGGTVVIGTVAPLRPEKNIGRLIRAFALLNARKQCRLVIVGDGSERRGLEELTRALALADRVEFVGHSSAPESFLDRFDIFAMSSDTEQIPNALLEAMAMALPIVATDVGDIAQIVSPENRRFVVPRDEPEQLIEAIATLADDPDRRVTLGRHNRARVEEQYSQDAMLAGYQNLLFP